MHVLKVYKVIFFQNFEGIFLSIQFFFDIRLFKNYRTQSVFVLQTRIVYQNIAERIRNKRSALDFSFSAPFFFVT